MKKFLRFFAGAGILAIVLSGCGPDKNAQTVQTQQVSSEETVAVTYAPPIYHYNLSQSPVASVYQPESSESYAVVPSNDSATNQSPTTAKNTTSGNAGAMPAATSNSSSDSSSQGRAYYVSMTIQPLYETRYVQPNFYQTPSNGRLFHNLTPPRCLNSDIYTPAYPCPGTLFHGLYYN